MKIVIIIGLFYCFSYAQPCDDVLVVEHPDTSVVKDRNTLIGNWKRNDDKSTNYNNEFNGELENSPSIEIKLNSIKYVQTYLHKDSSFDRMTITGMWFIENNVFRISGKVLKEAKYGKGSLKKEEDAIEYCTEYTFSNNMLCFEGLIMAKFYENPQVEIECFEKAGNQ